MLVHALDEVRHPTHTGLEEGDLKTGVALEHAAAHQRGHRRHLVKGKADAVDLYVVVETVHTYLWKVDTGRAVDGQRETRFGRSGIEGV